MMKKKYPVVILLLSVVILAAGCTGPVSPGDTGTETTVPVSPVSTVPVTTSVTQETLPDDTMSSPSLPEIGVTTVATTRIASDNPYLEYLNIRKRTFVNPLPNCLMKDAFPSLANDTGYGITQVEPYLYAISEDDYEHFLRKYTEGGTENTRLKTLGACLGSATAEPTWNFMELRVVLDPTNFSPANYTVTPNIWSDGKIVARFPTTQRLVIGEKVILTSYIPIRTDEIDLIDTVAVTYTRL
jgi:hypothetical protein